MMKTLDEIAEKVGDYAFINEQLIELARQDPLVLSIKRHAEHVDWDIIRALKTALVAMAAQRNVLLHQLANLPPAPIVMQCPGCPALAGLPKQGG